MSKESMSLLDDIIKKISGLSAEEFSEYVKSKNISWEDLDNKYYESNPTNNKNFSDFCKNYCPYSHCQEEFPGTWQHMDPCLNCVAESFWEYLHWT